MKPTTTDQHESRRDAWEHHCEDLTLAQERLTWEQVVEAPGKFEGEPAYVPYFWNLGLNGEYHDVETDGETDLYIFLVEPDDLKLFPELAGHKEVNLYEDSQGFVREVVRS